MSLGASRMYVLPLYERGSHDAGRSDPAGPHPTVRTHHRRTSARERHVAERVRTSRPDETAAARSWACVPDAARTANVRANGARGMSRLRARSVRIGPVERGRVRRDLA